MCFGLSMSRAGIEDSKCKYFFFLTNLPNHSHNLTHLYDHKNVTELFFQNIPMSCYYWYRLAPILKFWNEKTEKIPKFTPKNKKIEISEHDT